MNTRSKWNTKYIELIDQLKEPAPNPRLINISSYLKGGKALEFACGLGGNSVFLAQLNYQVQAIDISDVAINYLEEKAEKLKLDIYPQLCDLTELNKLDLQNSFFNLVVITYYLDRSLFPIVKRIIKENGYFFMETYYQSPQHENQGVSNQYKLQPKELLLEFTEWKVLYFEENQQEGKQTIFCQKC
ncbi:MAG TPA: class I SAM-dependent methyltransferase [Neobacillus sp.]